MSIVPKELMPKGGNGGQFIKGEEFRAGLTLRVKQFEIIPTRDPAFGANESDYLFKEGSLKRGQTIRYTFETLEDELGVVEPTIRIYESKSPGFLFAFAKANPEMGDIVKITKTGERAATRFKVIKVEEEIKL